MTTTPSSPQLAARRRRFARIRRAIATAAVAVFIALFGTVYARVAHQDAAATASTSTTATTTTAAAAPATTAATPEPTTTDDSSQLPAVTTSQS
jgi:hypothetical protein